jgi:hypothetical protein
LSISYGSSRQFPALKYIHLEISLAGSFQCSGLYYRCLSFSSSLRHVAFDTSTRWEHSFWW